MGYRRPSYDDVEDADTRFEWDGIGQRWLFRFDGRGAPVVVTDEEKERSEAIWQKGTIVRTLLLAVAYEFGGPWMEADYPGSEAIQVPIGIAVAFILFGPSKALIDWIATRHFLKRLPVRPSSTRLDDGREQTTPASWPALAFLMTLTIGITWAHWPPSGLGDGMVLGMAGLMARLILIDMIAMREPSRL